MPARAIALLHYAAFPVVGGVESVMAHHARLMVMDGYHVRVVAGRGAAQENGGQFVHVPRADSRHPDVLAVKSELDEGRVPAAFSVLVERLAGELARALERADLVIAHNVCSLHKNLALTAALRQYCSQAGAPRLICWHHDLAWTTPRYRGELHRGWPWSLLREHWSEVDPRHVVVSQLRRRELAHLFGVPAGEIAVAPSGLDVATFLGLGPRTLRLVRQLGLLEADPLLLLPVRITRRKNIELALRILAHVREGLPRARLVVTGPPGPHNPANQEYFDELLRLRVNLGVERSAHFLAEVVDEYLPDEVIADLFRLSDALLLPSREEGFGIPVLEAGLVGLPLYCADIAPLHEIAGEAAYYFPPDGDPGRIAQDMIRLIGERPTYQLRSRIRRQYSWEGVYAMHIAPLLEEEA